MSVGPFVRPSAIIRPSILPSVGPFVRLYVRPFVHPPVHQFVRPSVRLAYVKTLPLRNSSASSLTRMRTKCNSDILQEIVSSQYFIELSFNQTVARSWFKFFSPDALSVCSFVSRSVSPSVRSSVHSSIRRPYFFPSFRPSAI